MPLGGQALIHQGKLQHVLHHTLWLKGNNRTIFRITSETRRAVSPVDLARRRRNLLSPLFSHLGVSKSRCCAVREFRLSKNPLLLPRWGPIAKPTDTKRPKSSVLQRSLQGR